MLDQEGDENMNNKVVKEIISWVIVFAAAILLAMAINKWVYYAISSPTPSMEKTFLVDEKVGVFRLAYLFDKPKRGDIVVFANPLNSEEDDYIKRIIGLPGETVEGRDGVVYINGQPLKEDYLWEYMEGSFGPYEIPEGHYWMMGDNRNISGDSRLWPDKYVPLEDIRGKALFKYPKFKWFKDIDYGLEEE
jgi:signal peptidase I